MSEPLKSNPMLLAVLMQQAMLIHAALHVAEPETPAAAAAAQLVHEMHLLIEAHEKATALAIEAALANAQRDRLPEV